MSVVVTGVGLGLTLVDESCAGLAGLLDGSGGGGDGVAGSDGLAGLFEGSGGAAGGVSEVLLGMSGLLGKLGGGTLLGPGVVFGGLFGLGI